MIPTGRPAAPALGCHAWLPRHPGTEDGTPGLHRPNEEQPEGWSVVAEWLPANMLEKV